VTQPQCAPRSGCVKFHVELNLNLFELFCACASVMLVMVVPAGTQAPAMVQSMLHLLSLHLVTVES
jgi:hypothetical protein